MYGYTNIARVFEDAVTIAGRGTIGYTAIRKAPFLPVVRLITAIPDETKILLPYLYYVLKIKEKEIQALGTGGTIPQLTVPALRELELVVPDLETQKVIIAQITEYEAQIVKCEAKMANANSEKKAILDRYL